MSHLPLPQLESGLDRIREAPEGTGSVELIVRRPAEDERQELSSAELDLDRGLVGDAWASRPSPSGPGGGPNPEAQITVMSARAAALVTGGDDHPRWAEAGDQLFVDFDLSQRNLPPGSRLAIGGAVLEVSAEPHLGCGKFARRFGVDALKLVNSVEGRELRLRGLNARVVTPGTVRAGDPVEKL
jgi:MOSC domain-containing protein YiiM